MARDRGYIDTDVLTEARKRINHIFDLFDHVVVGFSGGKDSLATLHLTREVAASRGIDKVRVQFYDEELIPDSVINFVDEYRRMPWVDMTWLTVPLENRKYVLGKITEYTQWDPNRPHMRPMPEWGLKLEDFGLPADTVLNQYTLNDLTAYGLKGRIAILTGIRADESLTRLRASVNKLNENYINATGNPRVSLCKPIFDWRENDVFRYFYDNGIRYCPIYDSQVLAGTSLRVSSPLHAEAAKRIGLLRATEPTYYGQLLELFPEMAVQERYYAEFDQTALLDEYAGSWDDVERWVHENITDRTARTLALKRLRSVRVRAANRPDGYPLRYVLKQFVTGAYKREILPMRDVDGKAMIARDSRR